MKSATQSWFGAVAVKSRSTVSTRSAGRGSAGAAIVVLGFFPRSAPVQPCWAISRSTVHRATSWPLRRRWSHILRAPNRHANRLARACAISVVTSASRTARFEGRRDRAS